MQFEPGEWDTARTDPLFKPPFKSRAKILSAEDYAERPRVGFEQEFDSLRDAMVTLTWLDSKATDKIYGAYLELMSKSSGKSTSHEYVMRVLAQRFNITITRVGAIVQLAHNEDQARKEGKKLYHDAQDYVDQKVRQHITQAYSEYGEIDPEDFVEDPMGVTGMMNPDTRCGEVFQVDDLVDVESLTREAVVREQKEARLKIDNHLYIVDEDEATRTTKLNKETVLMMETQKALRQNEEVERREEFKPSPGDEQPRRERWKYAAVAINTREEKKNRKKWWLKKDLAENIVVEEDGEVRPATVAEVKSTCWKPKRNINEFTYAGVKAAWLERTLRGESGGWGRQEAPPEPVATVEAGEVDGAEENADEGEEASVEDSSAEEASPEEESGSEEVDGSNDEGDDKKD